MEQAQDLSQTLGASWQALAASLARPYFYIEMSLISAAITLAWLVAIFFNRRVERFLERRPPLSVDRHIIVKPLTLLAPLLAFFMLSLIKPFAEKYAEGSEWTSAVMQLVLAFIAARTVSLIVRSRPVAYFMALVIMTLTVLDVTGFMVSTKTALDGMAFHFGKFHLSMLGLVQGTIILVVVFWSARALSQTLESYLRRSSRMSYNTRELIVKFFTIFVYLAAFLITLGAMGIDLTALAIFGGALGVGVGLGLQKITANFVSGVTLLMEKSIKIGDLIEVNNTTGWVRALNIRYALIETLDGRELLIPNEMLMSTQVTNWTLTNEQARVDINVTIGFESDGRRARELMLAAAIAHPRCLKHPKPTCHLQNFTEFGQHFLLSFWIPDVKEGRLAPQSDVLFSIHDAFKQARITLVDRGKI